MDDFSYSLFAFLTFSSDQRSRRPCQPPVKKTGCRTDQICHTLPALRFAGRRVDNLGGRRQRPHLSRSPTPRRSGSVRVAHLRSQPEGSQDTRGIRRNRVERLCPQRPNKGRVQLPYAVSYSPSYNSKQRQTFSTHCSMPSKSCNFRAFSGKEQ